jgi:8-hydroxy-5-deazaflavin:NADPH oxidoreductase
MTGPHTVGVLGSGPMGRGFATLLSRAGYEVTLGTRHPEAPELSQLAAATRVSSFTEAATRDIAFIAVAHSAARNLAMSLAPYLAGKTLISCLNAWLPADYAAAGLSSSLTEGSWLARLVPQTNVARAFSHIDQGYLVTKAITEPGKWAVSYAADDIASAVTVENLIRAMGYVPYLVGTLAESAPLDYDGVLSHRLLTPEQMRAVLNHTDIANSSRKE